LNEDFWTDHEKASSLLKEKNNLMSTVDIWQSQKKSLNDIKSLYEMAVEEKEAKALETSHTN
jgi:hypothetical protein